LLTRLAAAALLARLALQRQLDQVAEARVRQDVLAREEPVVRAESNRGPATHCVRQQCRRELPGPRGGDRFGEEDPHVGAIAGSGSLDPDSVVEVALHSPVPIATGESFASTGSFAALLRRGGVRIWQPDPMHLGIIWPTRSVIAMAYASDIAVAPHSAAGPICSTVCLQLAACSPNLFLQELFDGLSGPDPPNRPYSSRDPSARPGPARSASARAARPCRRGRAARDGPEGEGARTALSHRTAGAVMSQRLCCG
jgi:hypothetical protein